MRNEKKMKYYKQKSEREKKFNILTKNLKWIT